jgi:hypothetical protein
MNSNIFWELNEAYQLGVCNQVVEEVLTEEEIVDIQEWVEALIEEGYDLDEYTDDELYEAYLEDLDESRGGYADSPVMKNSPSFHKLSRGEKRPKGVKATSDRLGKFIRGNVNKKGKLAEDLDLYDIVSEYLVSEGFCESYEDADVIMANMSEEWREDILEKADNTIRLVYGKGGKGVPIKGGSGNVLRKPNVGFAQQGRDFRMATAQSDETASQNSGKKSIQNRRNAARYDQALKKGIEKATNRSDRDPEDGDDHHSHSYEPFANRNARRRRASGK